MKMRFTQKFIFMQIKLIFVQLLKRLKILLKVYKKYSLYAGAHYCCYTFTKTFIKNVFDYFEFLVIFRYFHPENNSGIVEKSVIDVFFYYTAKQSYFCVGLSKECARSGGLERV